MGTRTCRLLVAAILLGGAFPIGLAAGPEQSPEEALRIAEQQIAQKPDEALAIARQTAAQLAGRPDLAKRLWSAAARLQEQRLDSLSAAQVENLAEVLATNLDDSAAAQRVQRGWLQGRRKALLAGDGPGRLHLARLYFLWLAEGEEAMALCHQALKESPRSTADLLCLQDLEILGSPRSVTRQILFGRYLEQRYYDTPVPLLIQLDCVKGTEPHFQPVRLLIRP